MWVCMFVDVFVVSKSDILEVGLVSAVIALSEAFRVPLLEDAEVLVEGDALVEVLEELVALGNFDCAFHAVIVEALHKGALIGEAWQLVIGLSGQGGTRYSWKAKGTSLTLLRWLAGRSRRCRWERDT